VAAELTETAPDGATREVARWAEGGTPAPGRGETVDLTLAGHAWQLVVRPTTPLPGTGRTPAEALLLTAVVLAGLLLAGLVLVLGVGRDRAVARAARADADRRDDARRAKGAEAALREREAELIGFAAAASENLQAPLNNIAGFTDLLMEEAAPQLDDAARGFLDRIGHSTRRMLALVDELLAYTAAADAALRLEHVDAAGLAAAAVADRVAVPPDERPSIDVGPLPVVTGDAALLGQVLERFIGNAVRFVRHGSTARVTVSARQSESGWWRIEVADRGIGVPAEHRDRIFAPFHRTPAAEGFPGTGLGLATCRRIVTLHGGEIGVDPNPGGGSVFWFTVPPTGSGRHADEQRQVSAGHA
jgi:signal transduction histidine kinase